MQKRYFKTTLLILLNNQTFHAVRCQALKISHVYTAGGYTGAGYKNDFIEIFNPTTEPVNLTSWTIQYGASALTSWQLSGTIGAEKYYLIKGGSNGPDGIAVRVDLTPSILPNLPSVVGKVALVHSTTALAACNDNAQPLVDLLQYGINSITCSIESNPFLFCSCCIKGAVSFFRKGNGCVDTNNNSTDFYLAAVRARNSSSPANTCRQFYPALPKIQVTRGQGAKYQFTIFPNQYNQYLGFLSPFA